MVLMQSSRSFKERLLGIKTITCDAIPSPIVQFTTKSYVTTVHTRGQNPKQNAYKYRRSLYEQTPHQALTMELGNRNPRETHDTSSYHSYRSISGIPNEHFRTENVQTENENSTRRPSSKPPLLIGVGGPSCSGKSEFCRKLMHTFPDKKCTHIELDWFYRGLFRPGHRRAANFNYDEPAAFDWDQFSRTLLEVMDRNRISLQRYDFQRFKWVGLVIEPSDVIILDGNLALHENALEHMSLKIFVDAEADGCLIRRLRMEEKERKRWSTEVVLQQYERFVKPGYEQYILPTKKKADLIVQGPGNEKVYELIKKYIWKRDERYKDLDMGSQD